MASNSAFPPALDDEPEGVLLVLLEVREVLSFSAFLFWRVRRLRLRYHRQKRMDARRARAMTMGAAIQACVSEVVEEGLCAVDCRVVSWVGVDEGLEVEVGMERAGSEDVEEEEELEPPGSNGFRPPQRYSIWQADLAEGSAAEVRQLSSCQLQARESRELLNWAVAG